MGCGGNVTPLLSATIAIFIQEAFTSTYVKSETLIYPSGALSE